MKKMISLMLVAVFLCTFTVVAAEESAADFSNVVVGDVLTFGSYEQDNDLENGPEPIEWIVLDVQDGKAFLLSQYGLDIQPYNTEYVAVTWEQCTLRKWLNQDFLKEAFNETEQSVILTTHVDNSNAQGYSKYIGFGGENTKDLIFLLSYNEAFDLYFASKEARGCALTEYVVANGAFASKDYQLNGRPTGSWWLRSPGSKLGNAAYVISGGSCGDFYVNYKYNVVRPALWISLESGIF